MGIFSRRVIFFPYPRSEADQPSLSQRGDAFDVETEITKWEKKHNRTGFSLFRCCQQPKPPLPASGHFSDDGAWHAALGRLTAPTDQLYIVGHCEKQGTTLGSQQGGLNPEDLWNLVGPHLPEGFGGIIKIHACESGDGFEGPSGSYAEAFAVYAYRAKPNCSVVGYRGAVRLGGPTHHGPLQVPISKRHGAARVGAGV